MTPAILSGGAAFLSLAATAALGVALFAIGAEVGGVLAGNVRLTREGRGAARLLASGIGWACGLGTAAWGVLAWAGAGLPPGPPGPFVAAVALAGVFWILYAFAWDRMTGRLRWLHVAAGAAVGATGIVLFGIAEARPLLAGLGAEGLPPEPGLVALATADPAWWGLLIQRIAACLAVGPSLLAILSPAPPSAGDGPEGAAGPDGLAPVAGRVAAWALLPLTVATPWAAAEVEVSRGPLGVPPGESGAAGLLAVQGLLLGAALLGTSALARARRASGRGPHGGPRGLPLPEVLVLLAAAAWTVPPAFETLGGGAPPAPGLAVFLGTTTAKGAAAALLVLAAAAWLSRTRGDGRRATLALAALPILLCAWLGLAGPGARAVREAETAEATAAALESEILQAAVPLAGVRDRLEGLGRTEARIRSLRRVPGVDRTAGFRHLAVALSAGFLAVAVALALGLRRHPVAARRAVLAGTVGGLALLHLRTDPSRASDVVTVLSQQCLLVLCALPLLAAVGGGGDRPTAAGTEGGPPRLAALVRGALAVVLAVLGAHLGPVRLDVAGEGAWASTGPGPAAAALSALAFLVFARIVRGIRIRPLRSRDPALALLAAAVAGGYALAGPAVAPRAGADESGAPSRGGTPDALVAAGRDLFTGDRAPCLKCHSLGEDPKARCPNLEGLGERAASRKSGLAAAEYLVESLYDPNAFVVPGFPRNQMTPVNRPPMSLSHDDIAAVLAFLNTLGGRTDEGFLRAVREAQEPWRSGQRRPGASSGDRTVPVLAGDPGRGLEAYRKHECGKCHRIGRDGADTCPDLTRIGSSQTADYVLESIIAPNAVIVRGYASVTVIWKDPGRRELIGYPVAWVPDRERPRLLRLVVNEAGREEERTVDLAEVAAVGDATVLVERSGEETLLCGDYVAGDARAGVTLKCLEGDAWAERRVPPAGIVLVKPPSSRMPSNFSELTTPREVYDLVAFLVAQKGRD